MRVTNRHRKSNKILVLTSILLMFSFAFFLFQLIQAGKDAYLVRFYERKAEKMTEENSNLENSSQINNWDKVETIAKNLNFERASDVYYITIPGREVVAR